MKNQKRFLSLLLIVALVLSIVPLPNNQVFASDWEECSHCGEYRSPDYLCNTCGGCGEETITINDCFFEYHCPCGACYQDTPICDECRLCLDCVPGDVMCVDCGRCEDCAGTICGDCQFCLDYTGFDEYCKGCDKCANCMGWGFCYECELCGDCTTMCSDEDCSFCEGCTGQVCDSCGQCALCAYIFCESCGFCGECCGQPLCLGCNYCSDCATVCECEQCCENCASLCRECERCENCVELCHGCGEYCSECRESCTNCGACEECQIICEECGDYCDGCSQLCQECNKCTECVDLCHNCGEYCSECRETCANCGFCEECADICKDCGEVCTDCGDLCSDCGEYCSDCRKTCEHCGTCEECANICEDCGVVCDDCANLCQDCNKCENCVHLCHDCKQYCFDCKKHCNLCDSCEECANICEDCGEVCDYCVDFCWDCNKCEDCINLCSSCGQYCDNCRDFCPGCNTCSECAATCPSCASVCDQCGNWGYVSLDNIQHQYQCSCGAPLHEPESHWFIYNVRKPSTATEVGFGDLKCWFCNYKETIVIPANGGEDHLHNFSLWVSNNKFHVKYCPCGEEDVSTKGDHEFQWKVDNEATIEKTGLKHQECIVCGYQLPGEIIPIIEHTHVYATTWTSNYDGHWHACSCGHKSDEALHSMGEWIVTLAATEIKPGSKERVCSICNYKQTLVIPSAAKDFTVTFDCKGGSYVPVQNVINGGKVIEPKNPSRSGYIFTGWYTTESGTTTYNFYQSIYEPITLYAQWELDISEPPKILTDNLRQCYKGVSYNEILEASGSAPITWSIIDGKLPNGLTLNRNTGEISGKSTEDGSFNFMVLAENKYDIEAKSYTLISKIKSSGGGGSLTTITYTIKTNAGEGGSFDTADIVSVLAGESTNFNIRAEKGYIIEDVSVDGMSVGAVSYYEFTKVNANHTIFATFKKIEDTNQDSKKCYYFTDIDESEWYFEPVMMACNKGWFSGTSDTTFSPNTAMTRGMIVTVLWRMENEPASKGNGFKDVMDGNYYTSAIKWAAEHKIVNGYGNDLFGPDEDINREQMAAILYRYAQYKGYDTRQGGMAIREFADYENISEYALPTLAWAVNTELIQGSGNNLMPKNSASRGQVAAILMRFSEKFGN